MKYKYLVFACIILILSISAVSAADNATEDIIMDDNTQDLSDLQTLIDEDMSGYVNLTNDYAGDANNQTVVINKNITIDGNGFSVDYLSNKPLFDLQADNITFINLIIKRHNVALGSKTVFTGEISESNPMVENCSFLIDNALPTIFANNITKIYKNDTQFYATIVDANNQTLANATVTFYINGVYYNRTTDSNGRAKLNINLAHGGAYIITSKNTVTNEEIQNIVEVISPFAMAEDLIKKYNTPAQFLVQLYGADGKIAGAGEIVTFYINGIYYNRTTDSNGVASLNINLMPGEYSISSTYNGYTIYNKVSVFDSYLETYDLVKDYGSATPFTVKVYDENGNRVGIGEEVQFNINGVDYTRTTDSNGVASLNINLRPGKYFITSTYKSYTTHNTVAINDNPVKTKLWSLPLDSLPVQSSEEAHQDVRL